MIRSDLFRRLLPAVVWWMALVWGSAAAGDPLALDQELDRIENLRLLHRYTIQHLHDARALALYLHGWKGPGRRVEVETLLTASENVYGVLRGVDHGGMALKATLDASGAVPGDHLRLVAAARRVAAARVNTLYTEARALKAQLADAVREQAAKQGDWTLHSEPEPWPEGHPMTRAQQDGLVREITLDQTFFGLPDADAEVVLDRAQRAGITAVALAYGPISNWGEVEGEAAQFDFRALDGVLARLRPRGMGVVIMLNTLEGSPPDWHVERFGEAAFLPLEGGMRRGIDLFHEPTETAFRRFMVAYAAHMKQHWPDMVDGFYIQHRTEEQGELSAPRLAPEAMALYWHAWSGSDTPWRDPETLRRDSPPDLAALSEAERCREQWLLDYTASVRNAIQTAWPAMPVQTMTTNHDFHWLHHGSQGRSRDIPRLARASDNPATRTSSAPGFELLRSFSDGHPLWSWGMHTGCGSVPSVDFAQAPFFDVSRINGGGFLGRFIRLQYPSSWYRYPDGRFGGFGMGSYIATPRRSQELAPVIFNTRAQQPALAILWSQSTLRMDRDARFFRSAMAWGHLLTRIQMPFGYLSEEDVAERLSQYRILVLPNTQYLPEAVCDGITAWVAGGGTLIASGAPGRYDEYGRLRESCALSLATGSEVARMRVPGLIHPDNLETTHPEGSYVFTDLPPRAYKFDTDLTAALRPMGGEPRAWFVGASQDVAIVTHAHGQGRSLAIGFPLGFEYWQCAPYELANGITHNRASHYNLAQKRYEAWVLKELTALGLTRSVHLPQGHFLRGQNRDDPDWYHIASDGPKYREYMFEVESPVRSVYAFSRHREGIDNLYIGLVHTEGNYFWERGYFRSMLSGGYISVAVDLAGEQPVVFDARLEVPVPIRREEGRLVFETWLPKAQASAFAVAPSGDVRLFGMGKPTGIADETLHALTREYPDDGPALETITIFRPEALHAFLAAGDTLVTIGCGDARYEPAARRLADLLEAHYGRQARIVMAGPRMTCRRDYMNGFGWGRYGPDPVTAQILIGNFQENGLMWSYLRTDQARWAPLEINLDFPGPGRAIAALSLPLHSDQHGRLRPEPPEPQLIIGASGGLEALHAVEALAETLQHNE